MNYNKIIDSETQIYSAYTTEHTWGNAQYINKLLVLPYSVIAIYSNMQKNQQVCLEEMYGQIIKRNNWIIDSNLYQQWHRQYLPQNTRYTRTPTEPKYQIGNIPRKGRNNWIYSPHFKVSMECVIDQYTRQTNNPNKAINKIVPIWSILDQKSIKKRFPLSPFATTRQQNGYNSIDKQPNLTIYTTTKT